MAFIQDSKKILEIIKLSRQAFGKYKWQIAILTGLGFLSGLLGGIGVNAVIPLFSVIVGGGVKGEDPISKYIEKFFLYFNVDFTLKYILIFIVLLFLLKAAISILFSFINVRITSGYEEKTRTNLFKATLEANWPYLLKQKLGHLEKVLMTNVSNSKNSLALISIFIMTLTNLIAYTLVAINISFYITLITFGLGGLLFFIFKPLIRRVRKIAYETEKINRDIAHHINENITGMKTVKIMSVGSKIANVGREYFNKIRNINIRAHILSIFSSSLMEPISVIVIVIVFIFSYKTSNFNFAVLVAVIYLAKQIFLYISQLQEYVIGMNSYIPYLKSILDYETQVLEHKERNEGSNDFIFDDSLEFRDVYFSYNQEKEILSGVNFKIKKGEMIGLIGPSGVGKTTIVDLILRLFEPTKGEILLDNKNIAGINLEEWRKNIGYVSQDIFLMNDTIANNIRFYDYSVTDKEIEEVAKMANIYDFIQSCPNGFSTIVGERGVLLSAGQRQRIIIARVLIRKPKLLILDEATSALDNESERKIQQIIEHLKKDITVFVIAHRLSTVINSDRLMVLENGKIIEQGEPQKLLRDKKSYFSRVYNLRT